MNGEMKELGPSVYLGFSLWCRYQKTARYILGPPSELFTEM